ncbi:probable leucine-rich repeat receptor-like protein kinase At5g49770 [Jatropha curcas]|uniref:probable leucine-rich repeat receptor-like protein kinase At5g49770 n=1 Tax=Jatropha curcas TaxID=180498 RepID=UPI001892E8B1|nr:probable leucine-rich repeat receptor-like protein kinase At5g49770 [Jatropha curcas]
MRLKDSLSGDISSFSELQILDLSNNKELGGPLPSSSGNLKKLRNCDQLPATALSVRISKSLNSNSFSGSIPPSIGTLSKLYWLDLADNKLDGPIPVSTGTTPGLDMLVNTKHFHFGENQLSGPIPSQLFSSDMTLIHLLFGSNNLSGSIPSSVGLVKTLEVVRFDRNSLTGPVPENLNNLTSVSDLYLSNNQLTGPFPNLTGMNLLTYLDISNNSFDASEFPSWISTLQSLTTLTMEGVQLQGQVPTNFFSLPSLQTVVLSNNQLNGSLDIGTTYGNGLQLVDLRKNFISAYTKRPGQNQVAVILVSNPVCDETGVTETYCTIPRPGSSYSTPPNNCVPASCTANKTSSPNCKCSYPYTGLLVFRAPSFSDLGNFTTYTSLQQKMMDSFRSNQLPVDSVSLSNPRKDSSLYLDLNLKIFPSGHDRFNRTIISGIGFVLSNQTFKPPHMFGPYYFIILQMIHRVFSWESSKSNTGHYSLEPVVWLFCRILPLLLILAGLYAYLILAGLYAYRQKKKAKRATEQNNPFAHWDSTKNSGADIPKIKAAKCFSFEELKRYTNNFSEANDIGSGGYGKVYRGNLPSGQLIAIKRAQQGSLQGGVEFKNEIELLSRVHHKNLVSLLGFCFERGEQMLVYEFVTNGSLSDSLSGKTGIRLDWVRRLKIALGAARGLAYMHELADPPIIHRDIKSTNILLDERLIAKVSDFGLSKACFGETLSQKGHLLQQVRRKQAREVNPYSKMGEVVKEIENILQLAGLNPNAESASTSASYEEAGKGSHPYSKDAFDYSGGFPPSKIEPQ